MTIGAVATVVGSLCPWVASGTVDRSSYEIIDMLDRLGFAEAGPVGLALRAWPVMPLLVVTGTVAMWWRRNVAGTALAVIGGVYALAVALTIRLTSPSGLVRIRFGPMVTIGGASVLVAATLVTLVVVVRGNDHPAGLG